MTLTKIGTVRQTSAVPSLRTDFWGRGDDKKLSALSSRLVRWLSVSPKANFFGYLSPFLFTTHKRKKRQPSRSSSMRHNFMGERGAGWRLSSQPTQLTRPITQNMAISLWTHTCVSKGKEPCLNCQMIKTAHAYIARWLN